MRGDCRKCGHYAGHESTRPCDLCSAAAREEANLGPIVDIRLVRQRDGGWYALVDGKRAASVPQYRGPSTLLAIVAESFGRRNP